MGTPQLRALEAIEARAAREAASGAAGTNVNNSHSPIIPFEPPALDKLKYHRLIDSEIYPKTSTAQRMKTIGMLDTILSNILNAPVPANSPKYKRLRMENAGLKKNIVDVAGAYEYLILCGFRSVKEDFEHFLVYPPSPIPQTLYSLRIGSLVIKRTLAKFSADSERENRFKMSAKDVEAERTQKAMLQFTEDRRLKKEKDDREKIVRDARIKAAVELAANPPYTDADMEDGAHLYDMLRNDPDVENGLDSDDGEAPPLYKLSTGGRILGTGDPEVRPEE